MLVASTIAKLNYYGNQKSKNTFWSLAAMKLSYLIVYCVSGATGSKIYYAVWDNKWFPFSQSKLLVSLGSCMRKRAERVMLCVS